VRLSQEVREILRLAAEAEGEITVRELADAVTEAYVNGLAGASRLFDALRAAVLPTALEQLSTGHSEWLAAMLQSSLSPGDHLPLSATERRSVLEEFLDDLVWEYVTDTGSPHERTSPHE
jgi:hypothetical protein